MQRDAGPSVANRNNKMPDRLFAAIVAVSIEIRS